MHLSPKNGINNVHIPYLIPHFLKSSYAFLKTATIPCTYKSHLVFVFLSLFHINDKSYPYYIIFFVISTHNSFLVQQIVGPDYLDAGWYNLLWST